MRQVNLDGTFYEVKGDIIKRAISPWMAKVSSGSKEYSDFSQAAMEEYHDFRNGIGKNRGDSSLARLQFSEGIDFTTEGQAVLGPLVNTAGTFGTTPVKILDFQNKTYTIGSDGTVKSWNTLSSEWNDYSYLLEDCEDTWDLDQHANATHAIDSSDYKVGAASVRVTVNTAITNEMLSGETISSKNLSAYDKVRCWIKSKLATTAGDLQLKLGWGEWDAGWVTPSGASGTGWTATDKIYDNLTNTDANHTTSGDDWSDYITITVPSMDITKIRFWAYYAAAVINQIDIDVSSDAGSTWTSVYTGAFANKEWVEKAIAASTVTQARVRFYNDDADPFVTEFYEFDFYGALSEAIDVPALVADTWTNITEDIPTPANCTAITRVGIKAVAEIASGEIVRVDDLRAVKSVTNLLLASPIDAIVVTDQDDEYLVVSSATAAIYWAGGDTDEWASLTTVKGYLAFYNTFLWGITTDGGTMYRSAANNIDGAGDNFTLSGQFGTVYDLFEGKLLADGTPIIYFCGTEGLFTVDTTNEKAYKQEVEYPPLTYSGHKGMYWNASVWVATGFGILKVTPSMATFVGPDLDDGLPSTYQGSIFDMITVNNWLVYCVNKTLATDKSSIIKRNSSYGGSLQVYTSAADAAIACLHHSPSSLYTNGRLWFGEGSNVKYMMFPDTTSNVKQISTYTYVDDSEYGYLPVFRKLAAITKVALGVAAITKSCDSNEYIELWYDLNGAGSWVDLEDFNDSPRDDILTFGDGAGIEFYTIQFRIRLRRATANTTNSPELESLLFYYMPVPVRISAWTFNILAVGDDGEAKFTAFEAIYDTKTLVAFYPSGDTGKTPYNVKLSHMPSREWWENQGRREGRFQVVVEQIFNG